MIENPVRLCCLIGEGGGDCGCDLKGIILVLTLFSLLLAAMGGAAFLHHVLPPCGDGQPWTKPAKTMSQSKSLQVEVNCVRCFSKYQENYQYRGGDKVYVNEC